MGSLSLPCFDSVTRVSRGEKEIGAVELETDKFDFEQGNNNNKENILMNKPTKNDWVCIANSECQATNRRGGLYCRMCGTAYKESYVKLKQMQKNSTGRGKEEEERGKRSASEKQFDVKQRFYQFKEERREKRKR